jgi:hypothetical protein
VGQVGLVRLEQGKKELLVG